MSHENADSNRHVSYQECSGLENPMFVDIEETRADLVAIEASSDPDELKSQVEQRNLDRETEGEMNLEFQFLIGLVTIGGPAAALLISFRFVIIPLLAAGSSPVSLVLAISVGLFLILCGIVAIIRVLR